MDVVVEVLVDVVVVVTGSMGQVEHEVALVQVKQFAGHFVHW